MPRMSNAHQLNNTIVFSCVRTLLLAFCRANLLLRAEIALGLNKILKYNQMRNLIL